MKKHIAVVASLQIGFSILGVLIAAVIFTVLTGIGVISQDEKAFFILSIIGSAVAFLFLITSIPGIIGGIGLFKYKNWARILIIIVSAIDLVNPPIGTLLGVYSIWALVQDETVLLFSKQNNSE